MVKKDSETVYDKVAIACMKEVANADANKCDRMVLGAYA